jgi:hypothetical protein
MPFRRRDYNRLPDVDPPPVYVERSYDERKRGDRNYADNRRMDDKGLPQGPSRDREGTSNKWHEWQPGEFQRSYPKSNVKNAAWYKTHKYGRLPGTDKDGWIRLAGPPSPVSRKTGPPSPVQKAAKTAGARAVGKGSPGRPQVDAKTTVKKGAVVAASAAKAAKKALGKLF